MSPQSRIHSHALLLPRLGCIIGPRACAPFPCPFGSSCHICARRPRQRRQSIHDDGEANRPEKCDHVHVKKLQLWRDEIEIHVLRHRPHFPIQDLRHGIYIQEWSMSVHECMHVETHACVRVHIHECIYIHARQDMRACLYHAYKHAQTCM